MARKRTNKTALKRVIGQYYGGSVPAAAEVWGVSEASVYRWLKGKLCKNPELRQQIAAAADLTVGQAFPGCKASDLKRAQVARARRHKLAEKTAGSELTRPALKTQLELNLDGAEARVGSGSDHVTAALGAHIEGMVKGLIDLAGRLGLGVIWVVDNKLTKESFAFPAQGSRRLDFKVEGSNE